MSIGNGTDTAVDEPSVLIVDDSPDKLIALESILLELPIRIVKARSGRDALRRLLVQDFAVILLDVRMPEMDGFETAALVRKRPRSERTPIIFITAFADELHVARGYSLHAVDYIITPVVPEILRTKVAVFVDLFRAAAEVKRQADCLEHRAAQLHRLTTASLAINGAASVHDMLAVAVDSARDILAAEHAVAAAAVDDRRTYRAASGRHVSRDDGAAPGTVTAPLVSRDGGRLGAIEVAGLPRAGFEQQDHDLLVQLAQITSIAIENALYNEVREANRLKDEFLATVSHELRTPLSAMLSWVAVLRRVGADPTTTARALEALDRNVRAQAHIVDDLLDVSRIVAGKLRLNVQRTDLRTVIEMAAESAAAAATAKGIELVATLDPDVETVHGDPDRLQQVVWNLLSNAIKFTPRGGHVTVRLARGALDEVDITVTDDGAGIPPGFLPHVFDAFRQADGSSTRSAAGLGLGLAIVRRLVELHGGHVDAHSAGVGLGAAFTVRLPTGVRQEVGPPETEVRPVAERATPVGPHRIEGLRVLAVEDDPDSRDALVVLLAEAGATVTAVATAGDAMAELRASRPDVLLCDIGLPGEDGYSLLARVRALPAAEGGLTPAVALTAYAQNADRVRALEAGFRVHLAKPVDPRELLRALAESAADRGVAAGDGMPWAADTLAAHGPEGGPVS